MLVDDGQTVETDVAHRAVDHSRVAEYEPARPLVEGRAEPDDTPAGARTSVVLERPGEAAERVADGDRGTE
jgi:hypothetical protein